jgi:Flp pilus assembly secretin CpaC
VQTRINGRTLAWGLAAALTAGWAAAPALAEIRETSMSTSSSIKVEVPDGVKKIFISNPNILDARPEEEGRAVLISALAQGKAEVRISRLSLEDLVYQIEVEAELQDLANEVKRMLADVEGLQVKIVGAKIALTGELLTHGDVDKAEKVAAEFVGQVVNLTTVDSNIGEFMKRALEKEIKVKTVQVKMVGERVYLLGSVPSRAELERVTEIAKLRTKNPVILLQVKKRP